MEVKGFKDFKFSPLKVQSPLRRAHIKKAHYRFLLVVVSGAIVFAHVYFPDWEVHVTLVANMMFALDRTV